MDRSPSGQGIRQLIVRLSGIYPACQLLLEVRRRLQALWTASVEAVMVYDIVMGIIISIIMAAIGINMINNAVK
jgi:hypothetical protein